MRNNNKRNTVRILVTGFDSFPDHPENPSKNLVLTLTDIFRGHSGIVLHGVILDTAYHSARTTLQKEVDRFAPDIVISFGVRANAPGFDLESTAHNHSGEKADADGEIAGPGPIERDGPETVHSTLPLASLKESLEHAGLPVRISETAGDYVCNELFYRLMQGIRTSGRDLQGGFIHIPYSRETAASYTGERRMLPMSAANLAKGGDIIIRAAAVWFKQQL